MDKYKFESDIDNKEEQKKSNIRLFSREKSKDSSTSGSSAFSSILSKKKPKPERKKKNWDIKKQPKLTSSKSQPSANGKQPNRRSSSVDSSPTSPPQWLTGRKTAGSCPGSPTYSAIAHSPPKVMSKSDIEKTYYNVQTWSNVMTSPPPSKDNAGDDLYGPLVKPKPSQPSHQEEESIVPQEEDGQVDLHLFPGGSPEIHRIHLKVKPSLASRSSSLESQGHGTPSHKLQSKRSSQPVGQGNIDVKGQGHHAVVGHQGQIIPSHPVQGHQHKTDSTGQGHQKVVTSHQGQIHQTVVSHPGLQTASSQPVSTLPVRERAGPPSNPVAVEKGQSSNNSPRSPRTPPPKPQRSSSANSSPALPKRMFFPQSSGKGTDQPKRSNTYTDPRSRHYVNLNYSHVLDHTGVQLQQYQGHQVQGRQSQGHSGKLPMENVYDDVYASRTVYQTKSLGRNVDSSHMKSGNKKEYDYGDYSSNTSPRRHVSRVEGHTRSVKEPTYGYVHVMSGSSTRHSSISSPESSPEVLRHHMQTRSLPPQHIMVVGESKHSCCVYVVSQTLMLCLCC